MPNTQLTSKEIFAYGRVSRTPAEVQSHPAFSHATLRRVVCSDCIFAYFSCSDSPSGVLKAYGWSSSGDAFAYAEASKLFRNSPFGPTRGNIAARQWSI